jgi:Ca2+-binding EF-hand superfamily protein
MGCCASRPPHPKG